MIKILNKREKIVLWLTLGVIIFSLIFNFLIAPVLTKNDNLNKEIKLTQTKLKRSLRLLSQKDYLKVKYNKLLPLDNVSGEPQDSSVSVLSELERLSKNADIRIIEIRPETTKKLALYKEIFVDLRAEGTMEGYLKFIYALEHSPLLLKIKKFQLTAKPNTPLLEANLSLSQLLVLE
ncbi:MAG: hypothetical protein AABY43_01570 [Candidatus Omnitrophota bacterium]